MLTIRDRKSKYLNTNKKQKAAFRGRGFQFDSKIYKKSLKLASQIIRQNEKNRTVFNGKSEKSKDIFGRQIV